MFSHTAKGLALLAKPPSTPPVVHSFVRSFISFAQNQSPTLENWRHYTTKPPKPDPPAISPATLFENNRRWAAKQIEKDPDFFKHLTHQQCPDYFWIGCSDSRVPANEIVGMAPGELFVHRNVANLFKHSDFNALAALQFAVDHLQVQHIPVVGHHGCGGVKAALKNQDIGLAGNWIRSIQEIRDQHQDFLGTLSELAQLRALCELNAITQARNVSQSTVLQRAWKRGQKVSVHAWVYDIGDGILQDMKMDISNPDDGRRIYTEAVAGVAGRYSKN